MTITKEQQEAMQRLWIERSTQWEQGAEGPAATDRGSFKCGFVDGIRHAEAEQVQKVQQLEQLQDELRKAIGRMDDMAKEYAAENARLRLHLDIAVEALEFCSKYEGCYDNTLEALAKIRGEG